MRNLTLLVTFLTIGSGCGDDGNPPAPDAAGLPDGAAPDDGSPPGPDAAPPDATPCAGLGGLVTEGMTVPVEGVQVCIEGHPEIDCVTTAADGTFGVGCFPQGSEFAVTFTKAGYAGLLFPWVVTPTTQYLGVRLFLEADYAPLWQSLGATYPSTTTGFVSIAVNDAAGNPRAGVSAAMAPASGMGPMYFDATFTYDPALTATTTAGFLVYANNDPGAVTLTFTGATCQQHQGGFSAGASAVTIPIVAGLETALIVTCP